MIVDMNAIVGTHDLLFVTLDTLRWDVAARLLEQGRTPNFSRYMKSWEKRHSPGNFTFASHTAFFAGFLPTPVEPGRHPRLFALRFQGSETTAKETCVLDAPDIVRGLADRGYHTACIGGVGFFNKQNPLGEVLPGYFSESHWRPDLGVTSMQSTEKQVALAQEILERVPAEKRVFLFVNVSALHQPNLHYLPGAPRDSIETHAAALEYVDAHLPRLFEVMRKRAPTFAIVCSDHGTAYGEDGYRGHRLAHETVWNVPYAHFVLEAR